MAAQRQKVLDYHRRLETQTALDCPRIRTLLTTHHRGCAAAAAAAAAAGLADKSDGEVLADEGYCQVMLRDRGPRLLELSTAAVDVEPAVKSAVAVFEGSEPWRPRVSVMQGRRET